MSILSRNRQALTLLSRRKGAEGLESRFEKLRKNQKRKRPLKPLFRLEAQFIHFGQEGIAMNAEDVCRLFSVSVNEL